MAVLWHIRENGKVVRSFKDVQTAAHVASLMHHGLGEVGRKKLLAGEVVDGISVTKGKTKDPDRKPPSQRVR